MGNKSKNNNAMKKQISLNYFLMKLVDLEIGKCFNSHELNELKKVFKEAKEIHKKEIEEAFKHGNIPTFFGNTLTAEQYYNETFRDK